jgi:hypothetical protein
VTKEKALTKTEERLLHILIEHLATQAIPPIGVALIELEELFGEDDKIKAFYDLLESATKQITEGMRDLLQTIPGVVIPTPDEIKKMIADSLNEKVFMQLLEQSVKNEPKHLN